MSMLITSLFILGTEVKMKTELFRTISSKKLLREDLICTVCEFFSCYTNGYLCRGLECLALFKRGKAFYIFDPLGIEVKEKKTALRRAVLYKFDSVDAMIDQLMTSLEDVFGVEGCCKEFFELGAFLCCPTAPIQKAIPEKPKTKVKKCKKVKRVAAIVSKTPMLLKDITPTCEDASDVEEFVDCVTVDDVCCY